MKTVSITNARQDLYNIVNQTIEYSEPIQITSKKGNAIILSEEDWRAIQETIYLTSIPGLVSSIKKADEAPEEEWTEDIGWDIH